MSDAGDEQELLDGARGGSAEAFESLVRLHQERVFSLICRQVRDEGLAADLTQDVFFQAWRKIENYDGRAKFSTWLHRIALNAVVSHHRKVTAEKRGGASVPLSFGAEEMQEPGADHRPGLAAITRPDQLAEVAELHSRVLDAIEALEPEFRQSVLMRDVDGLSYEEIAELLEISVGTVRSRIHRGRSKLRQVLAKLVDMAPEDE